jgi:anti-sigma regulatory factor (Ser/Thr protein kinase)
MTARPARLAARSASGVGWQWLRPAAEMALLACGQWRPAQVPSHQNGTVLPRVATHAISCESSVGVARDFTRATLLGWDAAERGDDVAVVVSELLTNALRHALPCAAAEPPRWPIRLGLLHAEAGVLCAVADPSDKVPVCSQPGCLDETGRGLHVVASLSDQWGCTAPDHCGKVVWAKFAARPCRLAPSPRCRLAPSPRCRSAPSPRCRSAPSPRSGGPLPPAAWVRT